MHSTEILFLIGFVVFIAAILILDMLVIDRKAHAVSIKEAGTWTLVWITLAWPFLLSFGFMVTLYMAFITSTICRPLHRVMPHISNSTLTISKAVCSIIAII